MIFIDGIIFSLQKFGGISTYVSELSHILKKSGIEVEVLCYDENLNSKGLFNKILKLRFFERYRTVKLSVNQTNAIFHSGYYRISRNKKIINIITIHDFIYEKFEKNLLKKIVHKIQKKYAIAHSKAVICVSENTRMDFLKFYPKFNPENAFVVHLSHSKVFELNENFGQIDKFSKPYVVFIGMRSFHKNFISSVCALKNIPELKFIIIGGGVLSEHEKLFLDSKLGNRYEHLLNIENLELSRIYTNAICLLYPSIYEGFGIPVLEAMASGCAVITSNTSSIPEVAGNAAILLDKLDHENIEEAIFQLLDKSVNRKYVKAGLENVKRFSWEKTAIETINVYKKFSKL